MSKLVAAKAHKSAIAILPHRQLQAWGAIQDIRVFNDKSFVRWPPHINLLYPFLEDSGTTFQEAAIICASALQNVKSFTVSLEKFDYFVHQKSATLWLHPDAKTNSNESNPLLDLQHTLVGAFPDCKDLSDDPKRGITTFSPHLSVGQWRNAAQVEAARSKYQTSWKPLEFEVEGVALLSRKGFDDPFKVRYIIFFGECGSDEKKNTRASVIEEVNAPYIATVGPSLGHYNASNDSYVYYFAYGANMSPAKLKTRGINPVESAPAKLSNWRLSFTHRGGMGNIIETNSSQNNASNPIEKVVYGVVHKITVAEYGKLANMEHEYRPIELEIEILPTGASSKVSSVVAIAFVTPEDRLIAEGLPPSTRYLNLLIDGCRHWNLNAAYLEWLSTMKSIEGKERGQEYYVAADGRALDALPKIRTGSGSNKAKKQASKGGSRQRQILNSASGERKNSVN